MTVPARVSAMKIDGCCRADGEWLGLSSHRWLTDLSPRLDRGEVGMEIWRFLSAQIIQSRQSTCRQPTKRCDMRWQQTAHMPIQPASTGWLIRQAKLFGHTLRTRLAT